MKFTAVAVVAVAALAIVCAQTTTTKKEDTTTQQQHEQTRAPTVPPTAKNVGKDNEMPTKLDHSLLSGEWYEYARSKTATKINERGCQCNVASLTLDGNAVNADFACLNSTVVEKSKGKETKPVSDEKKVESKDHASHVWAKGRYDPIEGKEGEFTYKLLERTPRALTDDDKKGRRTIVLALGPEFLVCFEPERKIVHVASRKPGELSSELYKAILDMLSSAEVKEDDMEKVTQTSDACSAFQKTALEHFASSKKAKGKGPTIGQKVDAGIAKIKDFINKEVGKQSSSSSPPSSEHSEGTQQFIGGMPVQMPVNVAPLQGGQSEMVGGPQQGFIGEPQSIAGVEGGEQQAIQAPPPSEPGAKAAPTSPAPPTAPNVMSKEAAPPALDLALLKGHWFLIASTKDIASGYLNGCKCTQALIVPIDSNSLQKVGGCLNQTDSQTVLMMARENARAGQPGVFDATLTDLRPYGIAGVNAPKDCAVIALGKDFLLTAEGDAGAKIYSRTPTMADDLFARLTELLGKIGFTSTNLVKTVHESSPQCAGLSDQMAAFGQQDQVKPAAPAAASAAAPAAAPAAAATPVAAPAAAPAVPATAPVAAPAAAAAAPAATATAPAAAPLPAAAARSIVGVVPLPFM